jgi:hypothetical protein
MKSARRPGGQLHPFAQQFKPHRLRRKLRADFILAMPNPITERGAARELSHRARPPGVSDTHPPRPRRNRVAGRNTLSWLVKPKIYPQRRRAAGECDVIDGEPASRLVYYPFAGHHPELTDSWLHRGNETVRLSARLITPIRPEVQGRPVIADQSPGARDRDRVHRDQGSGSRSKYRVARRPAGAATIPGPLLPGHPQILLGVKPCHASMLAQVPWPAQTLRRKVRRWEPLTLRHKVASTLWHRVD